MPGGAPEGPNPSGRRSVPIDERVRRAASGDPKAFDELILEWQAPLYGFLRSIIRDGAAAEDLAQRTFLKAYRGLEGWRGEASFKTWLFRIGLNEARSYLRWRKLRDWLPLSEALPAPRSEAAAVERRLEIDAALAALPPREREVVGLRLEGLKLEEIASTLGLSVGTVKSYLFWGLRKMRERLS